MIFWKVNSRGLPAALWLAAVAHGGELRVWTDTQGREIEARLLGLDADAVRLELKDGRKVSVPFAKLSAADVEYAKAPANAAGEPAGQTTGTSEAPNFDSPWPDKITYREDPEITIVEENTTEKRFVYESANFRYICDVRLSRTVVTGFAVMFEATHLLCRSLPLGLNGGQRTDGKLVIRLFEKKEDYVNAGGSLTSAGIFIVATGEVLVPLTSLGVRSAGSGYTLDRDKSSETLRHELTHQLSPEIYLSDVTEGWFSEGLAEYVANTPYRAGTFRVRGNLDDIIAVTTAYGPDLRGYHLGTKLTLPPLKQFMTQPYETFRANAGITYPCSLLITYYFMHMDGEGDAKRLRAMLKALHVGRTGEDALGELLDGRTFEQVEKELIRAWRRKGVEFTFR